MTETKPHKAKTLRLILGDQLNASHSWFRTKDDNCLYLIAELAQETEYVKHHIQKLVAFFTAMHRFADALDSAGHRVEHMSLDDTCDYADLPALIKAKIAEYEVEHFDYIQPDEYRLSEQIKNLELANNVNIRCCDSEHFYVPFAEIGDYFEPNKAKQMEAFYRKMRKRFNLLMQGSEPEGERWNFDQENRKKLTKQDLDDIPKPKLFENEPSQILKRLERHKVEHFGEIDEQLNWPTSRQESLQLLEHFCQYCLPQFGRFQDAMTAKSEHAWSLYHSRLSFSMNAKLISPMQVVDRAIQEFRSNEAIDLAQIEGFVRQIIGWREFMRGMYWANMPDYAKLNKLCASRKLPKYYWTGETKMRCMQQSIKQSLKYAYAHHIQRLMVTGTFSLLVGIDPDAIDEWYLGIYIDAIEWVEMPNTRGMSQYADGGLIASKPYIASGSYINKMSDYCKGCHYDVKARTGEKACPFNSLYWQFLMRHRDTLGKNSRIGMAYRNLDRMDTETQSALSKQAEYYLDNLETL